MEIPCPHFINCSGCSINQHVENPPVLEEMHLFFEKKCLLKVPLHVDSPIKWRTRAKLAVRGSWEFPKIGLYKEGTHEVVDIPCCQVHHPAINQAIEKIREWIIAEKIPPYNETKKGGLLRYLQLVIERPSGKVQLSLVFNLHSLTQSQKQMCFRLWEMGRDFFWHSIWVNLNRRRDNVILSQTWEQITGESCIRENVAGTHICFEPASFAQANLDLFEQIVERIQKIVPQGTKVVEYYAGVGVIGLALAEQSTWVKCCEINSQAESCFHKSKQQLSASAANKILWQQGAAETAKEWLEEADVVIVDPPRKGIESSFKSALKKKTNVAQLVYLSCGWEAFKKDSNELLEAGWCVVGVDAYLLFPGSNHIELLVQFKRS